MSRFRQYINENKLYNRYMLPDVVWNECQPFDKRLLAGEKY